MIFLPIVERELGVAARRHWTYWGRTSFALLAIIFGMFVYLANYSAGSVAFAENLFGALAWLCLLYCLFAGLGFTADCLSEEKREGTLGLLFLTDLKGHDVILGKLSATSLNGLYAAVAMFPLLAVPLLLGGITVGEFWRELLVLTNTFLFSLAIGMFASALSRRARQARFSAFVLLLFFTGLLPLCAGIILYLVPAHRSPVADILLLPCPIYSLVRGADALYRAAAWPYWWSVGVNHGLAWVFLGLAARVVPSSWQDRPAEARSLRWREWWGARLYGNAAQRKWLRQRLLEANPVCWLAGRGCLKPALVWACLGLVGALWVCGCALVGSEWFNEGVYYPTAILLNSMLKLWVASEAGRQFGEDRKAGTLELLLATPLSVKEILRGQLLALRRQFLGPLLVVVAVQLIFLAASLQRESFHDQPINPVVWLAGITMLVADVVTLSWVAMWEAMTAKKPNHITGKTVARILLAPWVLQIAINILAEWWFEDTTPSPIDWRFALGSWFVLGLLTDIAFLVGACWHLRTRFRALALRHLAPARSPLARLFSRG